MVAFERPVIVTGSRPLHRVFSQLQNLSWRKRDPKQVEWKKRQAVKLLVCCSGRLQGARFILVAILCMSIPSGASLWLDPRVIAVQKTEGVFTVSSPMMLFQGEDRYEERFEGCSQVRVQAGQVGDQFESVGKGLGSQMFEQQWAT